MRPAILLLMLFGFPTLLVAQHKKDTGSSVLVLPFEDRSQNMLELDVPDDFVQQDSVNRQENWAGRMPTFRGNARSMARMPNMKINDDVHYTMQIKRYRLEQSTPLTLPLDTGVLNKPKILPFGPSEE